MSQTTLKACVHYCTKYHCIIHVKMFKLATCLTIFVATGVNALSFLCRCEPSQPCWPSASDWAALNSSINGNLFAIRPIAAVCHDPTYDAAACAAVQANTHDSRYRSAQPGE